MRPASFISISKRLISVLVLLAMVLSGLGFLGRTLAVADGPRKNGPFLRDDREYDVLFFGSSHMINGVFPMELWKDYGLTSYNLAGHGASLAASFWELRLAVQYHKPKVAVLDVLFAGSQTTEMSIGLAHEMLDSYPLSRLKVEAVRDLFEESGTRAEMLFPLDVYHSRWKDLDSEMVRRGLWGEKDDSPEKGGQIRAGLYPLAQEPLVPVTSRREESSIALTYVEKFVTYCMENDIVPVLTYLPCQISEQWQRDCNAALALGEKLGAKILNMQYMDLIDYATDWYDDGSHLNPAGALKTTACLGSFLREQCGLEDHRGDGCDDLWNQDHESYVNFLKAQMGTLGMADQMLSLAAMEPFRVEAAVSEDFSDTSILRQLEKLGVKPSALETPGMLHLRVLDGNGTVLNEKTFVQSTVLSEAE